MTATISTPAPEVERRGALRHRWPTLVALTLAAIMVVDLTSGAELAPVLAISAAVYVGAAALRRREASWPVLLVTSLILTVVRLVNPPVDATWVILGAAVLLLGYGLVRGAWRPGDGLPRQTVALLGFSVIALAALYVDVQVGSYLVAAGLVGHAAWDALHHRTGRVVVRTFAEFCLVLDLALAAAVVVVTVWR